MHKPALPDDLATDRQLERRNRILDSAINFARHGGYEHVRLHDVADKAEVPVATLHHYFRTEVHLLMAVLERELIRFDETVVQEFSELNDPFTRLRCAAFDLIKGMEDSEHVADALSRAYASAQTVATFEAEMIRRQTSATFFNAMGGLGAPDYEHCINVADLVADVWTFELLTLVQGRRTYAELRQRISAVIRLVSS